MRTAATESKILIKRYGRERLYDTVGTRYVTVAELQRWASNGIEFTVLDTGSGNDVTQMLLA